MAKNKENNTKYIKIITPKCSKTENISKMKTNKVFSEATTELKANVEDIPSNIPLTEKDDIISVTKQAYNICKNLIFYWDNLGLNTCSIIPFHEFNNKLHIHTQINTKLLLLSNEKSIYVKTKNLLTYKKEEVITSFQKKIEESGEYLLYMQVINVDYFDHNESANITINSKTYKITSESANIIENSKEYVTEIYVSLNLEANQELTVNTTEYGVKAICLTKKTKHDSTVYKISNTNYVKNKKLTEYDKINETLTEYLGFLPESYTTTL